MNLNTINRITMNIPQSGHSVNTPQEENISRNISRVSTPITYPTIDGGLFVGYYLNIHG